MDKAIEQLFNAFSHIAREIQVYFISGMLVLLNIYALDYFYFQGSLWHFISHKPYILPLLLLAYVLGHICMGFYEMLLCYTKFENKLCRLVRVAKKRLKEEKLPALY